MPSAAFGLAPSGHDVAVATLMVGISELWGAGSSGAGAVALFGGCGVLRVVTAGERERHGANGDCQYQIFAHGGFPEMPPQQCGTGTNVHFGGDEFRVTGLA